MSFLKRLYDTVRRNAAEALGEIKNPLAIKLLIAKLKDDYYGVREKSIDALVKIGHPAVNPLIATLEDDDWKVQCAAAEALGKIGDVRAVEPLIEMLKDSNVTYRLKVSAAKALGELKDVRAVEPLSAALIDKGDILVASAKALGKIGDARAVEPLIAALKYDDGYKEYVVWALAEFKDVRAFEPLFEPLFEMYVYYQSVPKLYEDYSPNVNVLEKITKIEEALKEIDTPTFKKLFAELKNNDYKKRAAATMALSAIGDAQAINPLITALMDNNEEVRLSAVKALGQIGDVRAIGPLTAAFKNPRNEGRVDRAAKEALNELDQKGIS